MADCIWKRIYEHDSNGNGTFENLDDLVKAVKAGADVQIRYYRNAGLAGFRRVEWHRTSLATTIADTNLGATPIASCAFTDIPDTNLVATGRQLSRPFAFEWAIFNTTGSRHVVKFDLQTSAVLSDSSDNLSIAWYVRCYREPPWWDQLVGQVFDVVTRVTVRRGGSG